MKKAIHIAGLGALILAGAAVKVSAAGPDEILRHDPPRPTFEELDADADGRLTRAEMETHRKARFGEADANGDGEIARDELSAWIDKRRAERRQRMIDRMIAHRDIDGDGSLSIEEMGGQRGTEMFARADADGDGTISKAEFDEMKLHHRERREGMRDGDKRDDGMYRHDKHRQGRGMMDND